MAYNNNRFSAALFIALILFVALNPPKSDAQLLGNLLNLGGLNLTGALCCTANGNCPGQPLVGATVKLNCTNIFGITRTVAQTLTTGNGTFVINLSPLASLLLGPSLLPCTVSVQVPLLNPVVCPLLSNTTGILAAPVQAVGGLINTALGFVQNAIAGLFTLLRF